METSVATPTVNTNQPALPQVAVPLVKPAGTPSLIALPSKSPVPISYEATLQQLGIYTPTSLDHACVKEDQIPFVVDGLFKRGSIGIAVGDSGLGKSPLFYQLALCVASGKPWLGQSVTPGLVLYVDCENGLVGSRDVRNALIRHLGLLKCPENLLVRGSGWDINGLTRAVNEIKPALVAIDTLRSFDPSAEQDNNTAATFLNKLRKLSDRHGTVFLLVHHVRKQSNDSAYKVSLESNPIIDWLNQACGARGLINHTDVRIGIDQTKTGSASLIMKAQKRVDGDIGPFFLTRVFDDEQNPIGFRKLSGSEYLDSKEQREAYDKLPKEFGLKEAKAAYGKQDQATTDFLKKCISVGLLTKPKRGCYAKEAHTSAESA